MITLWSKARAKSHKGGIVFILCFLLLLPLFSCAQQDTDQSAKVVAQDPPEPAPVQSPTAEPLPEELPNVILIVLDTVSAEGARIGPESNMPELTSLAEREGYVFSDCWVTSDYTTQSHYSLFTGMSATRRENQMNSRLDRKEYSAMNVLSKCGYRTYGVSANYLLSGLRTAEAFDEFEDMWAKVNETYESAANDAFRSQLDERLRSICSLYGIKMSPEDPSFERARNHILVNADLINGEVQRLISDHLRSFPKTPFFLFINYLDAHDPYLPGPRFHDPSDDPDKVFWDLRTRPLPVNFKSNIEKNPDIRNKKIQKTQYSIDLSPGQLDVYWKRYLAEIREVDHSLGRLLQWFADQGLYDDSIFIVTSDHGESFGEEYVLGHWLSGMEHLKSTHHVPLVILPPSKVAGAVIREQARLCDIAPTLYEMLGAEEVYPYDGQSLLKYFPEPSFHRFAMNKTRFHLLAPAIDEEQDRNRRARLKESMRAMGYLQ